MTETVILDNGEEALTTFPLIISASRSTDIPAFYADWFFHRLKVGYSAWQNPFNNKISYIGYEKTRFIVFWSKNPKPLIPYLSYLKERGIGCYIQYTLNDYEQDNLETGVPSLQDRIETFHRLVDILGKGAVIWRFDPLILTFDLTVDSLIQKIENVGNQIASYTEKLVFSFADIENYVKVKKNLNRNSIFWNDWTQEQMKELATKLVSLNQRKNWNLTLATCGELGDFSGIQHNRCVEGELILRLSNNDPILVEALDNKSNKDIGQRKACGCVKSKDIGAYNTCPHLCEYCYANSSKDLAKANYSRHQKNPQSHSII